MWYLDKSSITVDAILTKRGREKLASGDFTITKFALADDEIDYGLWNPAHSLGTNYYGIAIDNIEEFQLRLDGPAGIKRDLAGAGWNSLCINADGAVYPSAAMAGIPDLHCGTIASQSLQEIWRDSVVCQNLRSASVEQKLHCL